MKKMLALLATVALFTSAATAQTTEPATPAHMGMHREHKGHSKMTPEQQADKMSQRLTQELTLSADQTTKVRAIILAHAQETDAIRTKYAASADRKAGMPEKKAAREKYEAQLKAVFTAEQSAKYAQMRQERKDKFKARRQEGKMKMKTQS